METMPSFQGGGINTFAQWVATNVEWPQKAMDNGISGRVIARFAIDIDGQLSDITIVHSPDKMLSDEVVRVLKLSPLWVPGKKNGQSVRVYLVVPCDFNTNNGATDAQ